MYLRKTSHPRTVRLPDGRLLSLADLPEPGMRWVASRKALVVDAVDHGLLDRDEAIRRYDLSDEELDLWQAAAHRHGRAGLRVTAIQRRKQPMGDGQENTSPLTSY